MSKIRINYAYQKRNRCLNELWRMDKVRYSAVIKALNIDHTPSEPGVPGPDPVQRKATLRKMTTDYCQAIKREKIDEFKDKLKSQQADFLNEKVETLKWIDEQMQRHKITEDDLKDAKSAFGPRIQPPGVWF